MVKVDLITGFLGVGKTTFIEKYAAYLTAKGEKLHVIENEFGGLTIDARTLREDNLDVSQIKGGCMCCTGRASFQTLLLDAAKAGFDRILVEPSGIYDVNSFLSLMHSDPVQACCTVGSIITIVDPKPDELLSEEARYLLYSQLIFTGAVVVSKTQLRTEDDVDAALDSFEEILGTYGSSRNLKTDAMLLTKPWDELTDADLAQLSTCGYRDGERADQMADHMSIFSTAMLFRRFDTEDHLREILHRLIETDEFGRIYRVKGYLANTENQWFELSCSASSCMIKPANVKRGLLLVIGQDFDEAAVENLFLPR